MLGVYPARPPNQALDMQVRRAWRAFKVVIDDADRSADFRVELHPTQIAFRPQGHRIHPGDLVSPANPAPFGFALRAMDLTEADAPQWKTWWFSADLMGGAGGMGPATFRRDDFPDDTLVIRMPGGFTVFSDFSATPTREIDPDDPDRRPLSPHHNAFVHGQVTIVAHVVRRFVLECNALGAVIGGPEN